MQRGTLGTQIGVGRYERQQGVQGLRARRQRNPPDSFLGIVGGERLEIRTLKPLPYLSGN